LQFSKSNFKADDINDLNDQYKIEAQNIINNSLISEYRKLNVDKSYIHYGMHGGSEWPGIAVDNVGQVIIPASNIAWISKLRNPDEFNFLFHIKKIFISSFNLITLDFYVFKKNVKSIFNSFKDIFNYKTLDIEAYKRFESKDGIPLNSPPWGTVTLIDIKDKKIKWQVPHGNYPQLDSKYNNKGSEIFGCPVFLGKEIFFISGSRDKKIYAYDVKNGDILWEDNLPYPSYGCPIIAEFDKNIYLIIDASGGRKFEDAKKGDAVIAYKLK
jgi:glucose dehydrogenase